MDNERIAQQLVKAAREIDKYILVNWEDYAEEVIVPAIAKQAEEKGAVESFSAADNAVAVYVNLYAFSPSEFDEGEEKAVQEGVEDVLDDIAKDDGIQYRLDDVDGDLATWIIWL